MGNKVLKPFDYSPDGHSTKSAAIGDELTDLPAASVNGLIAEGYIAGGEAAETLSKAAGEAMLSADLAGSVDSDKAVKEEADSARARISDGKVGAPEAASIVDAHRITDLTDATTVQAAQDEKAAHEAGDTEFDPKAPENVAAAERKVADGSAFDHDGDGKVGGSLKGSHHKKPAAKK